MTAPLRGGKTAPRLLQDLRHYDPRRLPTSGYNILTSLTSQYVEGVQPPERVGQGSCEHKWQLKENQCDLPLLDARPVPSTSYAVAAYCSKCRCHLDFSIDYRADGAGIIPCPTEAFPLHHFRYSPNPLSGRQTIQENFHTDSWLDVHNFRCSSKICSARLVIRIRPPRLTPAWVGLLTDEALIKKRADKAIADDPSRFEGHTAPLGMEILHNLNTYIHNAMNTPDRRPILDKNKKFILSLGEPCAELLQYLGFTHESNTWTPPSADVAAQAPFTNPINVLLDDVEKELLMLMTRQPEDQRRVHKFFHQPAPAKLELERSLGCQDYRKSLASRTIDLESVRDEHPYYGGLGTTLDFHDELIIFAYERQIECDAANAPYYLECLQGIARGRNSEDLQTKVVIESSSGKFSTEDVRNAYKEFGSLSEAKLLDDDTLIGNFRARIADAPKQEPTLRRALAIIGQSRSSSKIEHFASNTVTTYEQALQFLGADESIDDSFLVSMYTMKVNDDRSNEELARTAVSLIAEKRNSGALRAWLNTGELGDTEMDIGQAYTCLGFDDRTLDDATIQTAYGILCKDSPDRIHEYKRALAAIAKDKESFQLQRFLDSGTASGTTDWQPFNSQWPVGLENIGNTCYLNSLLQFYFTVKPLRDLVLNFDDFKMNLIDDDVHKKQVGSRKVSGKEIERAQKFVQELRHLFQNMITAPSAQVTPEQELARLTLISSNTEESNRRNSILSANRPFLGELDGRPVIGPLPPPAIDVVDDDVEMMKENTDATNHSSLSLVADLDEDASSEVTLIGEPALEKPEDEKFLLVDLEESQQQDQILQDKENLPPNKEDSARPSTPEIHLQPLSETSPSRANEQQQISSPTKEIGKVETDTIMTNGPPTSQIQALPPNRPPPVPPRERPEDHKKAIQEQIESGAQQDVAECIGNVLFQLQCAIKAESIDDSGEQLDRIKALFFGKQKSYTTNEHGAIRTKEEFMSDIKVNVASGPRDIYTALDSVYDVQDVEVGGSLEPQYTTISQLPPVLQVMVQRAQYDPEKQVSFKSNNHLELKETIYMDRYLDSSDLELRNRRQDCWKWKKRLGKLQERKLELTNTQAGYDVPTVLESTIEYLRSLPGVDSDDPVDVRPGLVDALTKAVNDARQELIELEDEIKNLTASINSQFNDLRSQPYRLHSVFIHRGVVSSGHYWIYIYDFDQGLWRKYNDGYVTEVKAEEVFEAQAQTNPANPYFLVYVKDESKNTLVSAVCRDVQEPQTEMRDIEMTDNTAEPIKWACVNQNQTTPSWDISRPKRDPLVW